MIVRNYQSGKVLVVEKGKVWYSDSSSVSILQLHCLKRKRKKRKWNWDRERSRQEEKRKWSIIETGRKEGDRETGNTDDK